MITWPSKLKHHLRSHISLAIKLKFMAYHYFLILLLFCVSLRNYFLGGEIISTFAAKYTSASKQV